MARFKLTLEYDGSGFWGWQSQPNGMGVQDALERAIARIDPQAPRTGVAGRTDRGVHALGQVAHADLARDWSGWKLREALNAWLRDDSSGSDTSDGRCAAVSVVEAEPVADDFDARFSARARHYLYRIAPRRPFLALEARRMWRVPQALDLAAMQAAAGFLTGTHDFSTFRDRDCQATSPVRTLDVFDIRAVEGPLGHEIQARLSARSFLHRQVRSMMGAVVKVGRGSMSVEQLAGVLAARDRQACPEVAPAAGLYLTAVTY